MRLVLVDLDGTLLPAPSCERRFILHLLRHGIIGPRQVAAAAGFPLRHAGRFGADVLRKNKAYLAGLEAARIAMLGERFAEGVLAGLLRPWMLRRLAAHAEAGDRVVLLTGTPDFLAAPLARAAGAQAHVGALCASRAGRYLAAPPIVHPFGAAKLELARRLCRHSGTMLDDALAYADSIHDLDLLEAVGHPVAVCPDRALARIARARGWEVLRGD